MTQVLADGASSYLYGPTRIGELQAGGFAYHLPDALGSVRQLANSSGAVTLAKSYQPFGEVMSSAGSGGSVFGWAGEARDATGLVFLRARYYSVTTGRFFVRDTWPGNTQMPGTLHPYLYSLSSPINYTDPTGLFCEEGALIDPANGRPCRTPSPFEMGQTPTPPPPTPVHTATATPTPPGYARSTPQPVVVPRAPGGYARDFDGFVFGTGGVTSDMQMADKAYNKLKDLGCTASLKYNAIVFGYETVYDFVHLQKATFKYSGVALVASNILNMAVQPSVYKGIINGFRTSHSINDYAGFALTRGGSVSFGALGASVGVGVSYAESTTPELNPTGIRGLSFSVGASLSSGLSTVFDSVGFNQPIDGYMSVTYYQVAGPPVNFLDPLLSPDRDTAIGRMIQDMRRVGTVLVDTGVLADLWGNSWNPSGKPQSGAWATSYPSR